MLFQKTKQRFGVTLHPACTAYYMDCHIEYGNRSFGFGRKVYVSRSIEKGEAKILARYHSLLREDGNTPFSFKAVGIKVCVGMVNSSEPSYVAAGI